MLKPLENESEVGYYMRLAVQCADKHMEASTGNGQITMEADEAFALFMLVRFANSHPKYKMDNGDMQELCMAQAAVTYMSIVLNGTCPDCGHSFDDKGDHECNNHCNQYPLPDSMDEPHPPHSKCH